MPAMSSRSLELDPIHLTSHIDKLKLKISSVAQLSGPQTLAQLEDSEFFDALSSGRIWLRRGAYCAFECQIFLDGIFLDTRDHQEVLVGVGNEIRNATLWSHLFLSPLVQIFSNDNTATSKTTFTIQLKQGKPPLELADSPRTCLSNNIDIQPPDSVLCAQFEKLFIKLEFSTTRQCLPVAKSDERNTEGSMHLGSTELIPLGPFKTPIDNHQLEEFEAAVQYQSQHLSRSIAECFEPVRSKFSPPDQMLLDIITPQLVPLPIKPLPPYHDNGHENMEDSAQEDLPLVEVPITIGDLESDMQEPHFQESEMLLTTYSPAQETVSLVNESHEENMLFSQLISGIPSLTSQSPTCSIVSTTSQLIPESPIRNITQGGLDLSVSLQVLKLSPLVKQGLHILIGGCGRRIHQETKGIQLRRPQPETSLSKIAPAIFSPGFRETMSHNIKFLSTISHTLSITLPRNAQSPMLRSNLLMLAQSEKSAIPNIDRECWGRGSVQRLAAVVQTRLWAMMHKQIYDPSAARKLAWESIIDGDVDETNGRGENQFYPRIGRSTTAKSKLGTNKTGEKDTDEFRDLFGADEEDLLAYFDESEIERMEIEQGTDEMLLGAGCDGGGKEMDNEILLSLEIGSEEDSMLL
ncbi:hypothetical protein BGZ60DRAFT_395144 [Tricladium varicosporioides]|nr:hypothetical protein BGZ60DRAFT_395144 [Hymenoscyphus varicosporioides]